MKRQLTLLLSTFSKYRIHERFCSHSFLTIKNDPMNMTLNDVGKFYRISGESLERLNLKENLPRPCRLQMNTLGEWMWMVRRPLLEMVQCANSVLPTISALRLVLWGPTGSGKTLTLLQTMHLAHLKGWVVLHVRNVTDWTRSDRCDIVMSSIKSGRIDLPLIAQKLLVQFKHNNAHLWSMLAELKTEREYEWSKVEKTAENRPITDIVDVGIAGQNFAPDCFGALIRELKRHATLNKCRISLLVTIDSANSLFTSTKIRRFNDGFALSTETGMTQHLLKLLDNNWTNGLCVLVVEKVIFSKTKDIQNVLPITPLELLGEEGFERIDPFVSVEIPRYSMQEIESAYQYYFHQNWITTSGARSSAGKMEMFHLSAFNPFKFERMCAFL